MSVEEVLDRDATGQAAAVALGELTAAELVEAAIARIEVLDPTIGALVHERFERARADAAGPLPDGPFRGVPFLLKDAVQHSEGDRYQHGTRFLRDHPLVSQGDTGLTRRYRLAGFVQLGRTKVPEMTMSSTTEPLAFGPTHNPWDLSRSSGGSSGGSAAAVAARMVAVAHGNDMGGSIRIPAACCGLVGLKPSRGRTTLAPDWGMYWGPLTHEHVLTRSVRDSAAVLDATAGPTPGDLYEAPPASRPWLDEVAEQEVPRLRVGLMLDAPSRVPVDPQCSNAAEATARLLEELGHSVEPFDASSIHDEAGMASMGAVIAASVARDIGQWERLVGATVAEGDLEPMTAGSLAAGRAMSAADYVEHVDVLSRWSRRIAQATGSYDAIVSPTMAITPPALGALSGDRPLEEALPGFSAMTAFALPFDISGQPAASLPLGWSNEGLPIGVQVVAAYGREDLVLRVAAQLERARPWADHRPPLLGAG